MPPLPVRPSRWLFLPLLFCITSLLHARDPISIAVNELSSEGLDASEARIISGRLRTELLHTEAFRVMERAEMERILKEQGFQKTGACDDRDCTVEVGQLLGVRQMLTGAVGKIDDMYTINTRMVDITTGEILYSVNVDCRCKASELLTVTTKQIAEQLADRSRGNRPAQTEGQTSERKPVLRRAGFWIPVGAAIAVGGGVVAFLILSDSDEEPDPTPTTGGIEFTW